MKAAGDVADDASREPRAIFRGLGEFLQGTYGYFVSGEFIGDVLASLAGGVSWDSLLSGSDPRRAPDAAVARGRKAFLDEEAVSRIKRQDTAITLTRNALRYVVFAIVALVV